MLDSSSMTTDVPSSTTWRVSDRSQTFENSYWIEGTFLRPLVFRRLECWQFDFIDLFFFLCFSGRVDDDWRKTDDDVIAL